ncbi:MAG: Asp-tRNA(Asn)/Glu-tRNA(Gln) amidotransferase GatCAB subunit B [Flavobacteriales bacterium]|nr:Asp-tRNA(Asn)/Glu-tRNA(Gln) amidotransferase GatCAB subunit B [Flavobacteriales bacterium]
MANESMFGDYEVVVGLEIHIQLLTKSKAYSSDSTEFGALPNSNISPISLGHPGTLPKFNHKTLEYGIRLGLACGSTIREENQFARKNYFYADLPKGYQITQDTTPLCNGGEVMIKDDEGNDKRIGITRIHMEEDSGKSIHDLDPYHTLIDLNRAGVPLLELVSEPDIRSPQEAYNYLTEVRKLVRYLEICDGNMEEGSMRCDANVSVRKKGSKEFGERTETKNLNSIRNVYRAIEFEAKRQIEVIEAGGSIHMETRGFDAVKGVTISQRSKEMAHDYRYFPEPDLQRIFVKEDEISSVKSELPPLPNEVFRRLTKDFELSEYDAGVLTEDKEFVLFFLDLCEHTKNYKAAANWMNGAVKSVLNDKTIHISEFKIKPQQIAEIIEMVDSGATSNTIANQKIFPALLENPEASPKKLAEENNWIQESNSDAISEFIEEALNKFPEKVEEYKAGKKSLMGLFMGEVMKSSKGKADPKMATQLLKEKLEQ